MERNNIFNNIYLIIVDFITGLSSWICFICINWFLLEITGSSSVVAFQSIIYTLAGLIISPFLGIFLDKYKTKKLISIVSLLRGFASLIVCLLVFTNNSPVYVFFILNFINGAGFSFYSNALSSIMRKLDNKELMIKTNSFLDISVHTSSFIAGIVASFAFSKINIDGILLFNAICFIFSGLIILLYNETSSQQTNVVVSNYFSNLYSGLKYILRNKHLIIYGIFAYFPTLIAACMTLILPIIVNSHFPQQLSLYSFSHSSYSIGMAIGCFFLGLGVLKKIKKKKTVVNLSFVLIITCSISLYYSTFSFIILCTMFLFGFACAVIRLQLNAEYIISQDAEYTGRVVSIMSTFVRLLQMICLSVLGFLNDNVSILSSVIVITLFSIISMGTFQILDLVRRPENNVKST